MRAGEPVDHWRTMLSEFGGRVEALAGTQWEAPTPCTAWNVRQLVEHVAGFQCETVGQLFDDGAPSLDFDVDPTASWRSLDAALRSALDAPGALDREMESPFAEGTFRELVLVPTVDLLFHTWDLSRAVGFDEVLPDDICEIALEAMLPLDEALRQSGAYPTGYADKVEPPPDADVQTRLLCFGGRRP